MSSNQAYVGAGADVAQGVAKALSATKAIPVIGIVAGIAEQILGAFTQAHQAAMRKEASTINSALPTFISEMQSVANGLNQGAITKEQALSYIEQAKSDYYTTVSSILHGHWDFQGSEYPEPYWLDSYKNRSGPFGTSDKNPDAHAPNQCNAACVLGHFWIDKTALGFKMAIENGGGSILIEESPNNGLIQGTRSVVIEYAPQGAVMGTFNQLLSETESALGISQQSQASMKPVVLLAVGALILFFVVKK